MSDFFISFQHLVIHSSLDYGINTVYCRNSFSGKEIISYGLNIPCQDTKWRLKNASRVWIFIFNYEVQGTHHWAAPGAQVPLSVSHSWL